MRLINETIQSDIIDQMDTTLIIESVSAVVNNEQTVTFKCVKWLKLYMFVTNGAYLYTATTVNGRQVTFSILTGMPALTVFDEPTLNKPILLNGTLLNTALEWTEMSLNEKEKLPFIWLQSPTLEREQPLDSGIEKSSDCKLWFVHYSDWNALNITRQAEAIKPLMALVDEFTNTINRNTNTFEGYDSIDKRDFPKFGTLNDKGVDKAIFPSTLSAIEYNISLRLFRKLCEKC